MARIASTLCNVCTLRQASTLSGLPQRGVVAVCDVCRREVERADLTEAAEWKALYARLRTQVSS